MTIDNFANQLLRQLGFLERSCISFDAGHRDEGIRIATSLRVLFHDTGRSTSLISHLNGTHIRLLSTVPNFEGSNHIVHWQGIGVYRLAEGRYRLIPGLSDEETFGFLQLKEWLSQIVWVLRSDLVLTRASIILNAANRDGGAHVDKELAEEYSTLVSGKENVVAHYRTEEKEWTEPFLDGHLVALRQMAYEVMNSPDLIGLSQHVVNE